MWIGIQRKTSPAISIGRRLMLPTGPGVTADQPKRTGKPPLKPPRSMLKGLLLFRNTLYTRTLSRMPRAIHAKERRFRAADRRRDIAVKASPNSRPFRGDILPEGSGRCRVLSIMASMFLSL